MTQFITKNGRKIPIDNIPPVKPAVPQKKSVDDETATQDLTSILKKKSQQEQ